MFGGETRITWTVRMVLSQGISRNSGTIVRLFLEVKPKTILRLYFHYSIAHEIKIQRIVQEVNEII